MLNFFLLNVFLCFFHVTQNNLHATFEMVESNMACECHIVSKLVSQKKYKFNQK